MHIVEIKIELAWEPDVVLHLDYSASDGHEDIIEMESVVMDCDWPCFYSAAGEEGKPNGMPF